MTQYLLMCRSLTYAQKSVKLLERSGITVAVVKAPQGLSGRRGYAVSLYRILTPHSACFAAGLISGKIFSRADGGEYKELAR